MENWIRAHATFAKSSRSEGANCVEVARTEVVCVRNSRDPGGPVLLFTRGGWEAFARIADRWPGSVPGVGSAA